MSIEATDRLADEYLRSRSGASSILSPVHLSHASSACLASFRPSKLLWSSSRRRTAKRGASCLQTTAGIIEFLTTSHEIRTTLVTLCRALLCLSTPPGRAPPLNLPGSLCHHLLPVLFPLSPQSPFIVLPKHPPHFLPSFSSRSSSLRPAIQLLLAANTADRIAEIQSFSGYPPPPFPIHRMLAQTPGLPEEKL